MDNLVKREVAGWVDQVEAMGGINRVNALTTAMQKLYALFKAHAPADLKKKDRGVSCSTCRHMVFTWGRDVSRTLLPETPLKIKVFEIWHGDDLSFKPLSGDIERIQNINLTVFFENQIINDVVGNGLPEGYDYYAFLSKKFFSKVGMKDYDNLFSTIRKADKAAVYSFFGKSQQQHIWRLANNWHPGILPIGQHLIKLLGFNVNVSSMNSSQCTVYQNAIFAPAHVWNDYVKHWLAPAIKFMQEDPFLVEECNKFSGYDETSCNYLDQRKKEYLKEHTGFDYFTMHTFVLERLWSTYLYFNKHLKLKQLW